jgi:hypothetical protein
MNDSVSIPMLEGLWQNFFHFCTVPLTLSIFRVAFGALLIVESIGLIRHGPMLFGTDGLAPVPVRAHGRNQYSLEYINLFSLHETSAPWIRFLFVVQTLACALLTVGLFTRLDALLIFLNFASRSKQNWYVIQGGDNVAKFMSLLLIFSNAGGMLSLDRHFGLAWLGGSGAAGSQWAWRLMQLQVSIVYIRTALLKLRSKQWIDGSAAFHALHANPNGRFKVLPGPLHSGSLIAFMTWTSVLIEFAAGTLIWLRETRYATMIAAVVMHIGFGVFLRLKYFQSIMVVCLLLFVPNYAWTHVAAAMSGVRSIHE